jgi:hypothetical protein
MLTLIKLSVLGVMLKAQHACDGQNLSDIFDLKTKQC